MFNWLVNNLGRLLGLVEKDTGCCFYPVEHYEEQVSENLWRGSRLNQELYDDLTRRGFTLVVSFCAEEKYGDKQFQHGGFPNPMWISVQDNCVPTEPQIRQFINLFTIGGFIPWERKIYCHCEAGKGRTGVFVACYRIAVQGWTNEAALAEAKAKGLAMPIQEQFIAEYRP